MACASQLPLSSLEAIESSIKVDRQVSQWFAFLVARPAVQSALMKTEGSCALYQQLKKVLWQQKLLCILTGVVLLAVIVFKTFYVLLGVLPLFLMFFKNNRIRRDTVAKISLLLLKKDFPQEEHIKEQTLYQLGEFYGEQYDIPTLVDVIAMEDKISRRTIICAFVLACIIYPLGLRDFLFFFIIAYYCVAVFIKTSLIYKHLK